MFFCFTALALTHLPVKVMETPAVKHTNVKKILPMTVGNNSPEKGKRRHKGMGKLHRRTGNFLPGGAVNHLPKKFLQVAQIFTKQSNRN